MPSILMRMSSRATIRPAEIARSLKKAAERSDRRRSSPFRSAMSVLTFYINRAGKNLSTQRKGKLEAAKSELRRMFGGRTGNLLGEAQTERRVSGTLFGGADRSGTGDSQSFDGRGSDASIAAVASRFSNWQAVGAGLARGNTAC